MPLTLRLCLVFSLVLGAGLGRQSSGIIGLATANLATIDGTIALPTLRADVRVVRDTWGVPHIYAQSADDLFFAQGFVMAQDRLWQMETWRRAAEGRLAEIVGPTAVGRDRIARLLKYRGPVDDRELSAYHPDARRLMTAYVAGVNAFISSQQAKLPIEFVLTGMRPEPWTLQTLLLRQIIFGDATSELQLARSVAELGVAEANRRRNPDPWDDLQVPHRVDVSAVARSFAALTESMRTTLDRTPPEILPQFRSMVSSSPEIQSHAIAEPGSNNWVLS